MKTHLINVGGVLRKPVGGAIIPDGVDLYNGLAAAGQVVLVLHGEDPEQTANWLELHGLVRHAWVSQAGAVAARELRREGYDLGLVVIADPDEALYHIRSGINTLLFTHAQYAMPGWRPDAGKGVRAWKDIEDETARLARMKAADERLKAGE